MSRTTASRRLIPITILTFLALVHAPATHAAVPVTDCDFTCNSDCELVGDLVCNNGVGIFLLGGSDLDLKGYHLICDNPSDPDELCTGPAVSMQVGSGSVVKDSGHAGVPKGGIIGAFAKVVDCNGLGLSQVTGISIDGVDGTAINQCAIADNNVIVSRDQLDYVGNPAIVTDIKSTIRNNYIGNFVVGIRTNGNKATVIDANVIEMQVPLGGAGIGGVSPTAINASLNTSTSASITNNTIIGSRGTVTGHLPTGPAFANNRCDETSADCQTCISNGWCTAPPVPYCLDRAVTLRPNAQGDLNGATVFFPTGIPGNVRWAVVNDFPDTGADGALHSGFVNATSSAKTDLFHVGDIASIPDGEFQSCVIEAHMVPDFFGGTVPVHLVAKLQGVESDGPTITVSGTSPALYTRTMTTNPLGTQWEGDDLSDATFQIGVQNDANPTGGARVGDVQIRCQ